MKAYGIDGKKLHNYVDNHPGKGLYNWWELELGDVCKNRARRQAKNDICKELAARRVRAILDN